MEGSSTTYSAGAALRCLWMAVGLWCCLNGQKFPARIGRPYFGCPLTPPASADIRLHGCQFPLLRLVPRVRDPTPVLQAAAVGVPSPLRQLVLHIRPASSTDRHPTPKPRPPYGNVLSADSFLEFKILKSQLPPVAVAGKEFLNFRIQIPGPKMPQHFSTPT